MKANLAAGRAEDARALGEGGHLRPDPRVAQRAARRTSCTTARLTPTATSTWARHSTRSSRTSSSSRRPWRASTRRTCPAGTATGCRSRIKIDTELGPRKAQMTRGRDPPRLPQVRREVRGRAARRISNAWASSALGGPVPHHERAVPVRHRGRVRGIPGPRLRLQRPEAGALVYAPSHRAGGSRSGVREPHQPVHLGAFRAGFGPREDRPGACRAQGLRADLDHHARGRSRPTWRSPTTPSTSTRRWTSAATSTSWRRTWSK